MKKLICAIIIILNSSIGYASDKLQIVTSFSILQDITQNITQDKAIVYSIVPPESDAHSYNIKPQDLIKIEKSNLFIINGLGFEGFLTRFKENKNISTKIVEAADGIDTLKLDEDNGKHHHLDPHAWQNPINIITYVNNITKALCVYDQTNCEFYKINGDQYIKKIKVIDETYTKIFENIPSKYRVMISTHDAFQYLAQHYNISIFAPLGIDNNSEPSAKDLANFNKLIKESNVSAIFIENITNNTLIEQLSQSNHKIINGELYSDSLAKSGECSTYIGLINHNLKIISDAMKSK
jgi:zinc/manganese transport system substrate-binding protein